MVPLKPGFKKKKKGGGEGVASMNRGTCPDLDPDLLTSPPLSCPQQISLCHGCLVSSTSTLTTSFSSQQTWDSGLSGLGWVAQGVRRFLLCSLAPALGRSPLWTESGLDTERIQNDL